MCARSIFSVYNANDEPHSSFLRPLDKPVLTGYFIYGSQTSLMLTTGVGVKFYYFNPNMSVLNFYSETVSIPKTSREFAINMAN